MKDFDIWNEIKKSIEIEENTNLLTNFPKESEVWVVSLGLNVGR